MNFFKMEHILGYLSANIFSSVHPQPSDIKDLNLYIIISYLITAKVLFKIDFIDLQ